MSQSPGLIEELSFKLLVDLFRYLNKGRIYCVDIRLDKFNRTSHNFETYSNLIGLEETYQSTYVPSNPKELGSLVGVQSFSATSDTFNFTSTYSVNDILGNVTIRSSRSYDVDRNAERQILESRQKLFLESTINEYITFYRLIRKVYITGIYSPLYAQPGWSQGTFLLNSIKEYLSDGSNIAKFPDSIDSIKKFPNR